MPEVIGCTNCKRLLKEIVVLESDIDMAADEIERLTIMNKSLREVATEASWLVAKHRDGADIQADWTRLDEKIARVEAADAELGSSDE